MGVVLSALCGVKRVNRVLSLLFESLIGSLFYMAVQFL